MSQKLATFTGQEIATGLKPGFVTPDAVLWEDGRNVLFDLNGVHSEKGMTPVVFSSDFFDSAPGNFDDTPGFFDDGSTTLVPMQVPDSVKITGLYHQKLTTNLIRVCAGTLNKLFIYEGGSTVAAKTGLTGIVDAQLTKLPTYWSMTNFGNWLMATNGVDTPQIYKSGPGFANLGGITFTRAEIIRKLGPHILALNTSNGPNLVEWCAEGEPEQWDPVSFVTAGRLPLQELENPIVCAELLGNTGLAVYTANEMQVVQYRGGTFTFGTRIAGQGFGAASKNAIVPAGSIHYGIEQNGVFATDGSQFAIKSAPALGKWLSRSVNWTQRGKIAGWHSRANNTVRWCLPTNGSNEPNLVLNYNYRTDAYSLSDQIFTVGQEASVFDYPIVGRFTGKVDFAEATNDERGNPITRWVRTKPLDAGDPQIMKYLDTVITTLEVFAGRGPQLYVRGLQDLEEATLVGTPWEGPFSPSLTSKQGKYYPRTEAPYLQLEFRSTFPDEEWQLSSFHLYGVITGRLF